MTNEQPNWNEIEKLNPKDAFMEGYKKGREDSKDLTDDLKRVMNEAMENLE